MPARERRRPSASVAPPSGEEARARIVAAVLALGTGEVASYGELAARAGLAGRARLVGRVLREAGDAGLPWHRVVRADGSIAFPAGSRARAEQVRRLAREGVIVVNGRVGAARRAAPVSLDAALWGPPAVTRRVRRA